MLFEIPHLKENMSGREGKRPADRRKLGLIRAGTI